uniref:Peptidase S1 domain-containing protein n=1 Tax=Knipowitschia caucasica TaxID=637954 RepID=A0AAV2LDW7_KNICA
MLQLEVGPGSSTSDNDIALIRLSSAVTFTDYIRPVCLAATNSVFNAGVDSWVTGFGAIREGEPLPFPETLQEVEVPVVGNRQCNCLNGVGTITDNMICAGLKVGGKDSCQGDSGGPMVSKQGSVWVQSGVVSFGYGCARPNLPGVYSRVSNYQSWINSHISSDQPGFVQFVSRGPDPDSSTTCPGLPPPLVTTTAEPQETTTVPEPEPTEEEPMESSAELCGVTPLNTRIVGGEDAPAGSWPWQVSLQSSTSDNDIALIRLSSAVTFTRYIRPVCLAATNSVFNAGVDSWVTGFGAIREGEPLPFPETLQEVEVPVVGNRQCNCLDGVGTITDNMICAGLKVGGKDSCQGDSGGPMVSKQGSVWVQSGVVSFGYGCARPNLPGVYSRVSNYQSWINSHISSDQPGFVQFVSRGPDPDSSTTCPGLPVKTSDVLVSSPVRSSIALMKLASPVTYTSDIQPVCVDTSNTTTISVGSQCWVAGFGGQSRTDGNKPTLRDLKTNVESCESASDPRTICTSPLDVQQGDQGGALLCQSGASWFQAAVVSMGGARTRSDSVRVFTKTSTFASFLKDAVGDMPSAAAVHTAASGGSSVGLSAALLLLLISLSQSLL